MASKSQKLFSDMGILIMWKKLVTVFEIISRSKTAAELARQGKYDLAHKIMLETK